MSAHRDFKMSVDNPFPEAIAPVGRGITCSRRHRVRISLEPNVVALQWRHTGILDTGATAERPSGGWQVDCQSGEHGQVTVYEAQSHRDVLR